jgi:hypothetical protein
MLPKGASLAVCLVNANRRSGVLGLNLSDYATKQDLSPFMGGRFPQPSF